MRLCSIASGSSGNCIYVGSDRTHLLVDTGISKKRIEEGLKELEIKGKELDGILITHEHADHIQGLGVFSRKYEIPIYGTPGTIRGIRDYKNLGKMPEGLYHEIQVDKEFKLGDIDVHPFAISHDANEPSGYRFEQDGKKIAVATDLGKYDEYTVENLKDLNAVLLESNHDIHMLEVGPYPYYLKQRVLGDRGHLSNELSGRLLCDILHNNLRSVLLGHLSKENNYEELAYETVKLEVRGKTLPYVSRGGLKLEKAMKNFGVTLKDKVCMDVGASTGGFTDCMLQNGAVKVYSIDVGYGQLDWKLRNEKNKYPLCGTGRSGRSGSIFFDRCFFYLPYKSASSCKKPSHRGRRDRMSHQTSV